MSLVRYVLNFSVWVDFGWTWVDCVIDALNFCVRVWAARSSYEEEAFNHRHLGTVWAPWKHRSLVITT